MQYFYLIYNALPEEKQEVLGPTKSFNGGDIEKTRYVE